MGTRKPVVITGAGGYLGGLLSDHFSSQNNRKLRLISRSPKATKAITVVDIGIWNAEWTSLFDGADAVVHLAGQREHGASWAQMQRTNINGTLNVFEAAARAKVRRVIFASTSWVLGGHFKSASQLTPDLPPCPTSHYAVTKLAGESIARHYAERHGLSVICFRIGTCHEAEQQPARIAYGRQLKWLSARDFCQGVERAIEAEGIGFAILNLTSRIDSSPWDISGTERLLGYSPNDSHRPRQRPLLKRLAGRLQRTLKRRRII